MTDTHAPTLADFHEALLRVERAARGALSYAIDTDEGQALRDALHGLDSVRERQQATDNERGRFVS